MRRHVVPVGGSMSPFHTVSAIDVYISADPADKEVYPQGKQNVGGNWVEVYALRKEALAKLAQAAGINTLHDHGVPSNLPWVACWHWDGERVNVDGTVSRPSGDYCLDLRLPEDVPGGGARYQQQAQSKIDSLTGDWAKDNKVSRPKGESWKDYIIRVYTTLVPADVKAEWWALAEESSRRAVIDMRPHMVSRAQTGALNRAIRQELGLAHTYTAKELQEPFKVYRARFDWSGMLDSVPQADRNALIMGFAAKQLGISPGELAQLAPPRPAPSPMPDTDDNDVVEYDESGEEGMGAIWEEPQPTPEPMEDRVLPVKPPRPLTAEQIRHVIGRKVTKGSRAAATDKQVPFLARKFQEAFAGDDEANEKYHAALGWLCPNAVGDAVGEDGQASARNLTRGQAQAVLDWLLDPSGPDDTGDTPLHPATPAEAAGVYRQAMIEAGQLEWPLAEGEISPIISDDIPF